MNTPTQATPEIRPNPAQSPATVANALPVDTTTPAFGAAPAGLCSRFWRVMTDEFAPEIKRGELVQLSTYAEPLPGEVVAIRAENQHGFNLSRFTFGSEALAVAVAVHIKDRHAALGRRLEQCGGIVRLLQNDTQGLEFNSPCGDVIAALRGVETLLALFDEECLQLRRELKAEGLDAEDESLDRLGLLIDECGGLVWLLEYTLLPSDPPISSMKKILSVLCALESLLTLARENLARVVTVPAEGAGRGQAAKEGGL